MSVEQGTTDANIISGSSSGTEYSDGAARGVATGTLAMGDDGTNIQSLNVDTTGKLNINGISGTVSLPTGASTETTLSDLNSKFNSLGQKTMANSAPFVIASDQTSIPTSVGLPTFLNSAFGFAIGINQPTASTDNPLVLLKNPNASGKTVYISFIAYGISVANVLGTIRVYKSPTITANGTAQTITAFGTGSTVITLFTTPTISANGTLLSTWSHGQNNNSLLIPTNYEITVPANSNLLITGSPGSNNRQAEVSIRWVEI